jgi:hypothetical protein
MLQASGMEAMTAPATRPDALDALAARVVILVGHFGSGKSEIALNLAFSFAERGEEVSVVDLDVVKPYFRCRQAREELEANGIHLVAPEGELAHADLPIILPEIRHLVQHGTTKVLMDVGGDAVGTRALGSLADVVSVENTHNLLVLNFKRPYTETVDAAVEMVRAIETAGRLPVTGLVSNTHLLGETTPEIVLEGLRLAEETAKRVSLPVVAAGVDERTARALAGRELACPLIVLKRRITTPFEPTRQPRRVGRLFMLN